MSEYNRANLAAAFELTRDVQRTLDRAFEAIERLGMKGTITAERLAATESALLQAQADLDRRMAYASE